MSVTVDERVALARTRLPVTQRALVALAADLIAERIADALAPAVAHDAPEQAPDVPTEPWQQLVNAPNGTGTAASVYNVTTETFFPLSVFARLTTSATVGERQLVVEYQVGTGERFVVAGSPVTVSENSQQDFAWWGEAGAPAHPVAGAVVAPLPQQALFWGMRLAVRVGNGDAGDVIDNVRISGRFTEGRVISQPEPPNAS